MTWTGERTVMIKDMKRVLYMPLNDAPSNTPPGFVASSIAVCTVFELALDVVSKMFSTSAMTFGVLSTLTLTVVTCGLYSDKKTMAVIQKSMNKTFTHLLGQQIHWESPWALLARQKNSTFMLFQIPHITQVISGHCTLYQLGCNSIHLFSFSFLGIAELN